MKKTTLVLSLAVASILMLPSCVMQSFVATGNPVGTKTGVSKANNIRGRHKDTTLETACKNGKITKIGVVEYRVTYFLSFAFYKTTVTGE